MDGRSASRGGRDLLRPRDADGVCVRRSSPFWVRCTTAGATTRVDEEVLPAWNSGTWPPPGDTTQRAEAESHRAASERFLASQGAGGRYVDLEAVGMFQEHRGRYALFRGFDGGGRTFSTTITRGARGPG